MLIRSLRAEGFLKFKKLRIENFPRRALIGIVGPNESGKSSIGQLFQFALFGSTHQMVRGSITDLIHWDDDHCIVELDFEHAGEGYRIWREMDRFGSSFARLVRIDKAGGPPGDEIASGALQVQREVQRRFHLGANETMHSFYLAERESVTTPDQFRAYLDRVTGVDVLKRAREKAGDSLDQLEKGFTEVQQEIQRNEMHISRLQPNIDKIPDLEQELKDRDQKVEEARAQSREMQRMVEQELKKREEVQKIQAELRVLDSSVASEALRKCNGLVGLFQADLCPEPLRDQHSVTDPVKEGLEELAEACKIRLALEQAVEESVSQLQRRIEGEGEGSISSEVAVQKEIVANAASSRVRNRAAAVVVFLGALVGILIGLDQEVNWGISNYIPYLANLEPEKGVGLMVAAVGAAFLVLGCWLSSRSSLCRQSIFDGEGVLSRLQMEQDVGSSSLEAARAHLARSSGGLDPGDDVGECRVRSVQVSLEELRLARRKVHSAMGDEPGEFLAQKLKTPLDRVRSTLKERRKSQDGANDSVKRLRSKRDRIQSEIREYQNQDGRRRALDEVSDGQRRKSLAIREEMDVHRLLVELLDETIESVRMRAGPSLGKGLCRLLPHLTGGRYRDAQVTPEFEIRLFTGEKSDFLQAHELSGGTLQGLSFGFRLAFAQAFVRAVTGAPQFLFLDEPFPAMDRERVFLTLQALPRLSQELSQVIVSHPDLDPAARQCFDLLIETDQDSDRLEIDLQDMSLPEVSAPRMEPMAELSSMKSPTPSVPRPRRSDSRERGGSQPQSRSRESSRRSKDVPSRGRHPRRGRSKQEQDPATAEVSETGTGRAESPSRGRDDSPPSAARKKIDTPKKPLDAPQSKRPQRERAATPPARSTTPSASDERPVQDPRTPATPSSDAAPRRKSATGSSRSPAADRNPSRESRGADPEKPKRRQAATSSTRENPPVEKTPSVRKTSAAEKVPPARKTPAAEKVPPARKTPAAEKAPPARKTPPTAFDPDDWTIPEA